MAKVKENGKARKVTSDPVAGEMDTDIVEEDKDVKDEVENKEQMSEEQVEEEDREEEQDEDEVDDQTPNEQLQPEQQLGTSDVDTNATNNGTSRVEELHEEDEKPKDSEHNDVEMLSNSPEPDKSVDIDGKVDETACTKNEQVSVGPCDEENVDEMSKGSEYLKCERASDNGCTPGINAGNGATCGESSAMDDKNLTGGLKNEGKMKEMAMVVDNVEKINDVSMAMESTERNHMFIIDDASEGGESGTEEEQLAFMKELEIMFRGKGMDFKAPKFYGEPLNLLKLWRAVIKLGGYDKVTACKLWRQVGESFNPPKTCTTVSWTFRIFYEKALLEYERHKISGGELHIPPTVTEPVATSQAPGSGRARRDAAARAMQGWHSQRLLGNGEVGDPIIKDKSPISSKSREKQLKSIGGQKRKKPPAEVAMKASRSKLIQGSTDTAVIDVGPPADWVKINVRTTKDCYEVYALVPGLLREEVRVQSDPAGRLVISGEPENADNPWGVTPFKKVVNLPSRIDPHQTSAVVTLHGQLFVRVPFEQSD